MEKKIALITGSAKGIGRGIALAYAREGYHVALHYRGSKEAAIQTKQMCEAYGVTANLYRCDLVGHEDVEQMIKAVINDFGALDVVINNAGITKDGLVIRMSEDDFDAVIDANLKGTFNVSKFASKQMFKQKSGRIINITSVIGIGGNVGQANYAASKAGIIGFTKSLAKELASRNILVNAIAPGFIETEMTAVLPQAVQNQILGQIPLQTYGDVSDVANLALFLGSEKNQYITGQVIKVDGGMML